MLPDLPQEPLTDATRAQLRKLAEIVEGIRGCTSQDQLNKSGLTARAREVQEGLAEQQYHPAVLAAVVDYNLVLAKALHDLPEVAEEPKKELETELHPDFESGSSHPTTAAGSPTDPAIIQMGEKRRWEDAVSTLTRYFESPENKSSTTIPVGDSPLLLEEWETRSLLARFPADEKSFRADANSVLKDATILMYRIADESEQLQRKAGLQYGRQGHEDSLVWLQERARAQLPKLQELSETMSQRGLAEKSQQVVRTARRLSDLLEGKKLKTTADPLGHQHDVSLLTLPDPHSRKPRP